MKRIACAVFGLWLAVAVVSCGNSSSGGGTTEPRTSGLTKRVLVSNEFAGALPIVNAENDSFSRFAVAISNQPGKMIVSADKAVTLVFSTGNNRINEITNVDEQSGAQVSVGDFSESFAISPDKKTAYVAVRNTNEVVLVDLDNNNVKQRVSLPLPRRLVLGPSGAKLLVFSDDPADAAAFYVVDTATAATSPGTSATRITNPVLDHPTWAVFTSDSNRAFVLSCGSECGGTTASVTDVAMPAATIGTNVVVDAATIGILDGSTLYVAGTAGGAPLGGMLSVLGTGPLTFTREVPIGDGFHHEMDLAANNKLYIAAVNCSKDRTDPIDPLSGCLSMYDRVANTAVMTVGGDVTGLAAISGRSVVYVVDDGELVIYDTATSAPQATQLDVIGRAVDVVLIDP